MKPRRWKFGYSKISKYPLYTNKTTKKGSNKWMGKVILSKQYLNKWMGLLIFTKIQFQRKASNWKKDEVSMHTQDM
jgi:hypothetical protein